MTFRNLIIKSFLHHKFRHLAVISGVIISTAVITASLIVGDSVKYSLNKIVDLRFGKVDFSLNTNEKFVRSKLSDEISEKLKVKASSLMISKGIIKNPENDLTLNKSQILGIDSSFWALSALAMLELNDDEAFISENIANRLNITTNDEIILKFEKLSIIPINSPYNTNNVPYITLRLKVKSIINKENLGNFNLKNNQGLPNNIFISKKLLCSKLELNNLCNLILINSNNTNINSEILDSTLKELWQLTDAGLIFSKINNAKYEIKSNDIFIDKKLSDIIQQKYKSSKTILSYLVNSLKLKENSTPYSFVSAISDNLINTKINSNEIVINNWLSEDLSAKTGDSIFLQYFIIDSLQNLQSDSSVFIVKKIISVPDSVINKSLMPDFPGIGNAVSCVEWNSNLPIDMKKIRDKDEDYWKDFRGTPKALISINDGKKIWQNKFGNYTAIRINKSDFSTNEPEKEIISNFKPSDLNFNFVNVRSIGINAAKNGVDFGELFLSLSFFVILAGIILTILLFSLNAESRKFEFGILAQLGFSTKQIFRFVILENSISIISGVVIGIFAGIAFNYLIIYAINSVWNDIVRTNMIIVYIIPKTLIISGFASLIVSFSTIYLFSILKLRKSIKSLLSKTSEYNYIFKKNRGTFYLIISILFSLAALGLIIFSLKNTNEIAPTNYLFSGSLFLFGCISFTAYYFKISSFHNKSKFTSFGHLAILNINRNLNRNLSIVTMLSLGIFIVIITGSNRKTFNNDENINSSGTGGYKLWLETSVPVPITNIGKDFKSFFGLDSLKKLELTPLFSKDGDDASCLNLNQIQNPKILGINAKVFDNRKSFSFEKLLAFVDEKNPWLSLNKTLSKNVIPAFADQTVITWGIKKKIGDTLVYKNEFGENLYLVICGGLSSSVFQGNILISEEFFKLNFPSSISPKIFLADIPVQNKNDVSKLLKNQLQDYGIEIENTSEKLAAFDSVSNTYLSVFMILGALGVLIGTVGLGIVIYRNLLDRKNEIALLAAVGFTSKQLFQLLFTENLILIFIGIVIGVFASIIGVLPSILSNSFNHPENFVLILILTILVNCLIWIYFPLKLALKRNLISSLRTE